MGDSSAWGICLPICLFICWIIDLQQYGITDIYFTLWVTFRYCFIYFVALIFPALTIWELFQLSPVSLLTPSLWLFCFCFLSTLSLSVTTRFSRLILSISYVSPRISCVFKECWFFLWENDIGRQNDSSLCYCCGVLFFSSYTIIFFIFKNC